MPFGVGIYSFKVIGFPQCLEQRKRSRLLTFFFIRTKL